MDSHFWGQASEFTVRKTLGYEFASRSVHGSLCKCQAIEWKQSRADIGDGRSALLAKIAPTAIAVDARGDLLIADSAGTAWHEAGVRRVQEA